MDFPTDADYERIIDTLAYRYFDRVSRDQVAKAVATARAQLEPEATRPEFVRVLVEREAKRLIKVAIAGGDGPVIHHAPELLFLCVHNQGRSPMAAALAEHLSGGHVHVRSAGTHPADAANPLVKQVLAERGVPCLEHYPSAVTDDVLGAADVVVHLGRGLPDLPGARQIEWDVRDPFDQPIEVVREICDDVHARVLDLLDALGVLPQDSVASSA